MGGAGGGGSRGGTWGPRGGTGRGEHPGRGLADTGEHQVGKGVRGLCSRVSLRRWGQAQLGRGSACPSLGEFGVTGTSPAGKDSARPGVRGSPAPDGLGVMGTNLIGGVLLPALPSSSPGSGVPEQGLAHGPRGVEPPPQLSLLGTGGPPWPMPPHRTAQQLGQGDLGALKRLGVPSTPLGSGPQHPPGWRQGNDVGQCCPMGRAGGCHPAGGQAGVGGLAWLSLCPQGGVVGVPGSPW